MAYKALVVDDDKVTLELLTYQLTSEGFETLAADNGNMLGTMTSTLSLRT